ncbi:MAG: DnaB-like helicase C-terminal domain-containing protein [Prochloraceae cyanobacterium]|nr:DnaB-like helicase C-terminal domain-containing protein [Prochloraceae cyanobacterium]
MQKLGDRAAGNRAQVIGKYSGACKDIAKQFNVPFVVLAQINRGVESQSNKRPSISIWTSFLCWRSPAKNLTPKYH